MDFLEGQKLIKEKNFSKALDIFVALEKNNYKDDRILFYLGLLYFEFNDFDKSLYYYENFIKKNPNITGALLNLAIVKQTIGDLDSAKKIYLKLIQHNKNNIRAYYGLYLLDSNNFPFKYFSILSDLNRKNKFGLYEIAIINFLLSKNEKVKKNIKKETKYLDKFHVSIFKNNLLYNNSSQFYYDKIINNHFDKIKISNKNRINFENKKLNPIFIIGLPRSGSTVIDSILTSSSEKVNSYGECHIINMSVLNEVSQKIYSKNFQEDNFEFKIDLEKFNENVVNQYSNFTSFKNKKVSKFVDKSLENFYNIELIYNIFPNAKFLHTYRNISDSIISIYQSMLPDLSWAHSIDNILKYIDNYLKVLDYYKQKYPNLIFDINLEHFTSNTEKVTKQIFEFCDLNWEKKILDFYKRKNLFSKTLSFSQIRSKVEKYNINKYKPYYYLFDNFLNDYKWLKK